jgi:NAD(P)-dependent dehydrogenase (short-subunit alcohol dehydrogenase family)
MARIVLVTGGNRGIGLGVVRHVVEAGDIALLGARNIEQARDQADATEQVAAAAGDRGRVEVVPLDVNDPDSVK